MSSAFISYASEDCQFAQQEVVGMLRALGLDTWFAPEDIPSSSYWETTILMGLERCDWFIVMVSTPAVSSEWVKREVSWAFEHRPHKIIPIRMDDCDPGVLDNRLNDIQHLDSRSNSKTHALQRLVQLLVDREYKGLQRQLDGTWLCAVQPVYYSRRRDYHGSGVGRRWIRDNLFVGFHGSGDWHIQNVQITSFTQLYIVDTLPAKGALQWQWKANLVANTFLVGRWDSKRRASGSHGYMCVQIARNGTYMFGHDYAVVWEEAKAHYGVLLFGKDEDTLEKAWEAMRNARRTMPRLTQRIEFNDA